MDCKLQVKLYNSFKKYGVENHRFEIICECEESQLNYLEMYLIRFYDTFNTEHGLNLTSGGEGGKKSDETKERMSIDRKNRIGLKYENGEFMSEEDKIKRAKEKNRKWAEEHPQRTKDRKKKWHIKNRKSQLLRSKTWAKNHPDRLKELNRNLWIKNKDRITEKRQRLKGEKKKYDRENYLKNKEITKNQLGDTNMP